jgi:hypothetical protein
VDGVFCNICRGDASGSGDNRGSTGNGVCSEHFGFRIHLVVGAFVLVQGLVQMFGPYHEWIGCETGCGSHTGGTG